MKPQPPAPRPPRPDAMRSFYDAEPEVEAKLLKVAESFRDWKPASKNPVTRHTAT